MSPKEVLVYKPRPSFEEYDKQRGSAYHGGGYVYAPQQSILSRQQLEDNYTLIALTCLLVSAKNFEPDENLPKMHAL